MLVLVTKFFFKHTHSRIDKTDLQRQIIEQHQVENQDNPMLFQGEVVDLLELLKTVWLREADIATKGNPCYTSRNTHQSEYKKVVFRL